MTTEDRLLKEKLAAYFDEHFDEILADLSEIMSIDSSFSTPSEGKPFGEGSAAALAWGAKKGGELGLNVRNFDNYAVSMTCGVGEPVLGILSHLDVVPASPEGWQHTPFACTVDGGYIYGRGAIDDKGPSVAVLWAVKALKELNVPLTKAFRVIFGGNEEQGCNDIAYYQTKEPFPPMVFTPDGSFPVLNCEKGMIHLTFSAPFEDTAITSIKAGTVINAIPDRCSVTGSSENFEYAGKPSHGSRPENGDNAITKFLAAYKGGSELLKALARLFPHGEFDGKSCGLGFSDEISGQMTCALTMLNTSDGRLCGGIDIRYPIDRTLAEISGIITKALENAGFAVDECEGMEPHYVSADSPLVQTLLQVYEDVKGERGEPVSEGGVTYVHNTPGGVAFGAEFPWEDNRMHGIDERVSIETYKLNLNMYANAIARLCR
ncbi:MAG: Sapep family Mn(2+)-dependent dipeptidase [Ruminococcus sp.]|nr:Sapep family Mn(2+)-dependent dipeptidase [Ruminococcus sp.]